METVGKRVRFARQECGFTMKQLHDLTGLSTGNISDIENDRNTPSVASLIPLSRALKRSLDWLLTGEEATTRHSENTMSCDGVDLSQVEADLIAMFRILGERDRETAFDFVTMLYEKASGEKGSVYSTYIDDARELKQSGPAEGREAQDGTA